MRGMISLHRSGQSRAYFGERGSLPNSKFIGPTLWSA
jgi:hypothetical protein